MYIVPVRTIIVYVRCHLNKIGRGPHFPKGVPILPGAPRFYDTGIKKRPLVEGFLYTSAIVISIGATAGIIYREVIHWWEGPLWEVPP